MKKVSFLGLVLASFLAFQACESKTEKTSEKAAEEAMDHAEDMNDTLQTVDSKDAEFAMKAASGGMFEVQAAQLAETKASSPKVKEFASMMIKDHGKANDELKMIASEKGITLPAMVAEDHQEMINELTKLSGKDFDKKYVNMMVDDHEKDLKEFNMAATDCKDTQLKGFASKTSGVVQQHLNHIKQIKSSMK